MAKQPGFNDPAWNTVYLDGVALPGICSVNVDKSREIDKKHTKGKDGCKLQDNGYTGASLTIKIALPLDEHWFAYQELLPRFDPKNGGIKAPIKIRHPEPNSKGISEIYIESISGEPPTCKDGKVETWKCFEWFPQTKETQQKPTPAPDKGEQFGPPAPSKFGVNIF